MIDFFMESSLLRVSADGPRQSNLPLLLSINETRSRGQSKIGQLESGVQGIEKTGYLLSAAILNAESALGVSPLHGTIDAGDHAGAALETTRILHDHLPFFVEGIEICRTGIDAETFFAWVTDFLVKLDMSFFIILEGIESQLLGNLHEPLLVDSPQRHGGHRGENPKISVRILVFLFGLCASVVKQSIYNFRNSSQSLKVWRFKKFSFNP
jgi:hypothetical protein